MHFLKNTVVELTILLFTHEQTISQSQPRMPSMKCCPCNHCGILYMTTNTSPSITSAPDSTNNLQTEKKHSNRICYQHTFIVMPGVISLFMDQSLLSCLGDNRIVPASTPVLHLQNPVGSSTVSPLILLPAFYTTKELAWFGIN